MSAISEDTPRRRRATQGEAVAVVVMWGALLLIMLTTYSRIEPADLYNVTHSGLGGGMSRVLVQVNYPVALVAVAVILVSMDVLGGRWWWLAAPGIGLCAVTAWPGVVDDADLDARMVNAFPALGVGIAVALSCLAVREVGLRLAPGCRLDRARVAISAIVLIVSLPWLAADLGWFLPDLVFITERPITGSDGSVGVAVHLGHHHGLDGALLVVSALALSRVRLDTGRLIMITDAYLSLMFAYGAVNFAQDLWHEQVQKRGWTDWLIPGALEPAAEPVWLFILIGAAAAFGLLQHFERRPSARSTAGAIN